MVDDGRRPFFVAGGINWLKASVAAGKETADSIFCMAHEWASSADEHVNPKDVIDHAMNLLNVAVYAEKVQKLIRGEIDH